MTDATVEAVQPKTAAARRTWVFRHSVFVRITHWIWVVSLVALLMSGLQIFNAHPSLNFGNATTFDTTATGPNRLILNIDNNNSTGITQVLGHTFQTSGVLGVSKNAEGQLSARAFPSWLTLPADQDLAGGRQIHFLFAWILIINGFVYLAYGVLSGHLWRDVVPKLRDLAGLPHDVVTHLRLRFTHGPDAPQYNILQKLAYGSIIFVILPILVIAGIEMSPGMDSVVPWLKDLFGGRQSARTVHFICAWLLVAFVIVHVAMVFLSGFFNNMRSMITGRFAVARGAIRKDEH